MLTVKLLAVVVAGSGLTVLVGGPESIVTSACLVGSMPWLGSSSFTWSVAIGLFSSNVIRATLRIWVPVAQARVGLDREADIAHPAPGAVLRRQEPGQHVGRQLGVRVDALERGVDLPGGGVDAGLDVHVERLAVVGHRDGRLVVLAAGRDRQDRVAPADAGELEGAPVQVGVELVGDRDGLGRGGGRGGVLEVDLVGEDSSSVGNEVGGTVAGGADHGVRVGGMRRVARAVVTVIAAWHDRAIPDQVKVKKIDGQKKARP